MPRLPRSHLRHGCVKKNRRSKHLFAEGPVPRLPSFSRLRADAASICSPRAPCLGYLASHGCARTDAASICSPRAPCLGYLASHGCARTDAASICSPRAPCLGYLASHGCANRRSKHLFAEGPVPRLPSFSRLRSQTQQASVRRGPRASAT